jgi:hypothetical protein
MASTFSQQLRYLRKNEPALYESVSKAYRKCLIESNLAPYMVQPDAKAAETPVEKTEIKQTNTKEMDNLMDKVHAMVGVNENKKEGSEIFDMTKDDVEQVQPDPQQQAELFGETSSNESSIDSRDNDEPTEDDNTEELTDFDIDNLFSDDSENNTESETSPDELVDLDIDNLFET